MEDGYLATSFRTTMELLQPDKTRLLPLTANSAGRFADNNLMVVEHPKLLLLGLPAMLVVQKVQQLPRLPHPKHPPNLQEQHMDQLPAVGKTLLVLVARKTTVAHVKLDHPGPLVTQGMMELTAKMGKQEWMGSLDRTLLPLLSPLPVFVIARQDHPDHQAVLATRGLKVIQENKASRELQASQDQKDHLASRDLLDHKVYLEGQEIRGK